MNIDIDTLSADLAHELAFSPLEKALPPKLQYRFYKWMKQFKHINPKAQDHIQNLVEKSFNHISAIKELKKNEVMTSFFKNGCIRMDFGSDVDQKVKEAAMKWAKKKGLKATEASLDKSVGVQSHIIYSSGPSSATGLCDRYVKYTI